MIPVLKAADCEPAADCCLEPHRPVKDFVEAVDLLPFSFAVNGVAWKHGVQVKMSNNVTVNRAVGRQRERTPLSTLPDGISSRRFRNAHHHRF